MTNHTWSWSFYVQKKVEEVKEEVIRAWGKQLYVLAPCCVVSCSIFIRWSVNMGRSSKTLCDDHAELLTLSENYRRLSVVTRPWQNSSWTSLTVQYRSTDQEPKSQKSPRLFHNANVSSGTVCLGFKETAQLTKICLRSVLITFPLNCENIISECSMNVQNSCFFNVKKTVMLMQTLKEHTIKKKLWWCYLNVIK